MLSILIPIHNYDAFPLVKEVHKQCLEANIDFEIICIDDASNEYRSNNNPIQLLSNCIYTELSKNIGRSAIRNLLASKSKQKWLLFLDCDTFPEHRNFITSYFNQINNSSEKAFFGGLKYVNEKPNNSQLLRWIYGKNREAISLANRQKNPYNSSFFSNFLIQKSVFETILFDEKISTYGYEDYSFIASLKHENIAVEQIENPVFHLNLETSELFLAKTKIALETLLSISRDNPNIINSSKIIQLYKILCLLKVDAVVSKLFRKLQIKLEKNLKSKKPSLLVFDLYKIGYFCSLNSN
jgi:hypothetical protein